MKNLVKRLVEGEIVYELNTFRIVDKAIFLYARDGAMLSMADVPELPAVDVVASLHRIKSLATDIRNEIEKLNKKGEVS